MKKTSTGEGKRQRTDPAGVAASSDASATLLSANPVLFRADLWTDSGGSAAPPPASAIAMVNDLLLSASATISASTPWSISATFANAPLAVIAAHHLRSATAGFSQSSYPRLLHHRCTLSHAGEHAPSLFESDRPQQSASEDSDSGNVYVVGDLCATVKQLPGLAFVPADSNPLLARRSPSRQLLRLKAPAESNTILRELGMPHIQPDVKPNTRLVSQEMAKVQTVDTPVQQAAISDRYSQVIRHLRSYSTRWIAAASAACILLLVTAIAGRSLSARTQPAAASGTIQNADAPVPALGMSPAPGTIPKTAPMTAPQSAAPVTTPSVQITGTKLAPHKTSANREPPAQNESARGHILSPQDPSTAKITFNAAEIAQINRKAERLAGDGHVDEALALFEMVLRRDPNNQAARDGLAVAKKKK